MSKTYGDLTERLLKLPIGKSGVLNVHRPDRYLKTVRKYAPESDWRVEHMDGGKVVTRVR